MINQFYNIKIIMENKRLSMLSYEEKKNLVEKLGELLIEFDINAEVEIIKTKTCELLKNCEVEFEEYIYIRK
jgi:hypothetical protein